MVAFAKRFAGFAVAGLSLLAVTTPASASLSRVTKPSVAYETIRPNVAYETIRPNAAYETIRPNVA